MSRKRDNLRHGVVLEHQRKIIRAMSGKDRHTVYYLPRAMGKSYVQHLVKKIGEAVNQLKENPNE